MGSMTRRSISNTCRVVLSCIFDTVATLSPTRTAIEYEVLKSGVRDQLEGHIRCDSGAASVATGATQADVVSDLKFIDECRVWLKSQTDRDIKRAYNEWLNYFEDGALEAQKELDRKAKISPREIQRKIAKEAEREAAKKSLYLPPLFK